MAKLWDPEVVWCVSELRTLQTERKNVEQQWDDVERYVMPLRLGKMRESTNTMESSILWDRDELRDTTAIIAAQREAASIHGAIVSPSLKWFDYEWLDSEVQADQESAVFIQGATGIAYDELYQANFDPEISSFFQDCVGVGTSGLSCEAEKESLTDWRGLNFDCLPIKELFHVEDHRNRVLRLYRVYSWNIDQIVAKFGLSNLPEAMQEREKAATGRDQRYEVAFVIYHRINPDLDTWPEGTLAADQRPVGAKWIITEPQCEVTSDGGPIGYYEFPAFIGVWERTSGSKWGHSPGMIMAPTAKYLNAVMEMIEIARMKTIDPSSLATERGVVGKVNLFPGGVTIVKDIEKSLKPYESGANINVGENEVRDLRQMIKDAFHYDELQLKDSPAMSATEAQIRYELMNRILGPTLARIQTDVLDPLLLRVFKILLRNNRFGKIPDMVKKKKAQLRIKYSGPLMRAQKTDEVTAMERYIATIGAMAKVFPSIVNLIDPYKVGREIATRLNIPASIMRTATEVQQLEAKQQEAQQQAQQAAILKAQGEAHQAAGQGAQAINQAQAQAGGAQPGGQ